MPYLGFSVFAIKIKMIIKKSVCMGVFLLFLIMGSFICFGEDITEEERLEQERLEKELLEEIRRSEEEAEKALEEIRRSEEERLEEEPPEERPILKIPGVEEEVPRAREIPERYERPDYSALEQKATYIITAVIILFILVLGDIVLRIVKWIRGE